MYVSLFHLSFAKLWKVLNLILSNTNFQERATSLIFKQVHVFLDWATQQIFISYSNWAHLWQIDYFVDCHYSGQDDRLWVIGGTSAGTLGYFPVNYKGKGAIGPPEAVLHGGHTGIVRSVLPLSGMRGAPTHTQGGIFGWTGGEDGRLCCWMPDESSDANRSWISSKLVMKSPKTRRKSRHHPY